MRPVWLISWVLTFPLFKLLTGVEIVGRIPKKGPLIIASNHKSFLDPPLVAYTAFREVFFLAKPNLFALSKFFAWLIRTYNAVSIAGTEGLRTAVRLLKQGKVVVIFPEGTRLKTEGMLPFNPGMSYLAITYDIPVVPVYITNSNKSVGSLLLRMTTLRIKFGTPVQPSGYNKTKEDFERFAVRLREEVMNLQ
jgi:1-acyl-sn-glycerol-3-phosphate acyltransferase